MLQAGSSSHWKVVEVVDVNDNVVVDVEITDELVVLKPVVVD